jgi:tetratricopeptide (TPR) repeat protein
MAPTITRWPVNLHNLAAVAQGRGDRAAAERLFTTALQIKARALGDRHPEVAVVHNNLAVLYTKQGRTEEALRHYDAALDILQQTVGSAHPTTVTCRGNRVRLLA